MRPLPLATLLIIGGAMTLLNGCSAPLPATTVTAAAPTVTATPSHEPADALTPLTAWSVCYGFLTRYADRQATGFVIPQLRSYDPKWVTASAGRYQVQLSPDQTGWGCDVSGTLGAPRIESWTSVP